MKLALKNGHALTRLSTATVPGWISAASSVTSCFKLSVRVVSVLRRVSAPTRRFPLPLAWRSGRLPCLPASESPPSCLLFGVLCPAMRALDCHRARLLLFVVLVDARQGRKKIGFLHFTHTAIGLDSLPGLRPLAAATESVAARRERAGRVNGTPAGPGRLHYIPDAVRRQRRAAWHETTRAAHDWLWPLATTACQQSFRFLQQFFHRPRMPGQPRPPSRAFRASYHADGRSCSERGTGRRPREGIPASLRTRARAG